MNPMLELELLKTLVAILSLPDVQTDTKTKAQNALARVVNSIDKATMEAYSGIIN